MLKFLMLLAIVSFVSSTVYRPPYGTPYFGHGSSAVRTGVWYAEIRYPGMTMPYSLYSNEDMLFVWDNEGSRWFIQLNTPNGPIKQWAFYNTSYAISPGNPCYIGNRNYSTSNDIDDEMSVKTESHGHIDIYRGVNWDAGVGYQAMWNEYQVDTISNETVGEDWSSPVTRGKVGGACPPNKNQFYGKLRYHSYVRYKGSVNSTEWESYFEVPSVCENAVLERSVRCWDNWALYNAMD